MVLRPERLASDTHMTRTRTRTSQPLTHTWHTPASPPPMAGSCGGARARNTRQFRLVRGRARAQYSPGPGAARHCMQRAGAGGGGWGGTAPVRRRRRQPRMHLRPQTSLALAKPALAPFSSAHVFRAQCTQAPSRRLSNPVHARPVRRASTPP
jgi:hypothetical protein